MVEYYIEAIDQQGRPQTLTLAAKNSTMADELVRSQGLQPTLITHAKSHARKIKEQTASRKRRRQFGLSGLAVVCVVLLAGVALSRYIVYLEGQRGFTLDAIRGAAAEAGASGSAVGSDAELTAFAQDLFGAMHLKFPGLIRGLNVKSDSLMFVYLDPASDDRSPQAIRLVTQALALSLQAHFQAAQCTVLVLESGVTVADARSSAAGATVNMHIE